jgi:cytochrome c oxidase subunit 2
VRRLPATIVLAALTSLVAAGVAVAGNGVGGLLPQSTDSPNARGIHTSYLLIGFITLFIFVLVEGALLVFIVKFRRGKRDRYEDAPQIHGSTKLEIMWTVFPAVILAAIATFVLVMLPKIQDIPSASANGGRIDVEVQGHQFYWMFVYPNGAIGFDDMRVPVARNVKLTIVTPPGDVNHSWWVPKLGGKTDAIPGRTNTSWFRAGHMGTYRGQCAELCGVQHAHMRNSVEVVESGAYASYIAQQKQLLDARSAEFGKQEFDHVCSKCHNVDVTGPVNIGPNLGGNPLLKDAKGLGNLVRNGRGNMPAVGINWNDDQVAALVAYTKTIGGNG